MGEFDRFGSLPELSADPCQVDLARDTPRREAMNGAPGWPSSIAAKSAAQ